LAARLASLAAWLNSRLERVVTFIIWPMVFVCSNVTTILEAAAF
jgi:hypothetical protein